MAKQKSADELEELISEQLDILSDGNATDTDIKKADSIANLIGKSLKHAAERLAYREHIKQGGKIIIQLESVDDTKSEGVTK
jgi:hypothetical protein